MKRRNKHPRKESERFQAHPEYKEPIDTAKEIEELSWQMDFEKQTPEKEKERMLTTLIKVNKKNCPEEAQLKQQGFKTIETSVFHPDDLLITDMQTGDKKLDDAMLGHFANRYIANFTNEGLKQGKDWDIAKRDDGTYIICVKR
jgi:hypothetical protein